MFAAIYMFFMGANLFFAFQGYTLNTVVFIFMATVFVVTGGFGMIRR
jgi:hypothetical protein